MSTNLSFVLGSYNRKKFLKVTIESIRNEIDSYGPDSEIIVVDGGSTDGSAEWLIKQKDIITITQHNHGIWNGKKIERRSWGYFMNLGFKCAQGKYICMLSDDCLPVMGAIRNGIDLIEKKMEVGEKIGGAAFYWRDFPGADKYWAGTLFGSTYLINHGVFLKSALEEVGYIDEKNYKFYYADSDLCLRLNQKGYLILLSENSFVEHYSHANYSQRKKNSVSVEEDKNYFMHKWAGMELLKNPYCDGSKGSIEYCDPLNTKRLFNKAELFNYHLFVKRTKDLLKWMLKK